MANRAKKSDVTITRIGCRATGEYELVTDTGFVEPYALEELEQKVIGRAENCPRKASFDPGLELGCKACIYARIVTTNLEITASYLEFLKSTRC